MTRQTTPKPKQPTISALKAVVHIVCVERDAKGEVIAELYPQEPLVLYSPDFDRFPEKLEEALKSARAMVAAEQNGSK